MEQQVAPKILVVDDVEANRFYLRDIIHQAGYMPVLTESGAQALKVMERMEIDLVILDVAMPDMDGFEVCHRIKENVQTREIPIIFSSALDKPQHIKQGFACGGADYITKPFIPDIVKARINIHLQLYKTTRQLQDMNHKLQLSVIEQLRRVEKEKKNVLYALLRVARENAAYDEKHMERISKNCRVLAEAMQLTKEYADVISDVYVDTIELAAPVCDIGNVAVPTEILQKTDRLTSEENHIMQRHTEVGERILQGIEEEDQGNDFIQMSKDIVKYHHENWDGTGYPTGISGEQIPLSAQIVNIVTSYCALTEERSYRSAFSKEDTFAIMKKEAQTKFNPQLYEVLFLIRRQLV